MAADLRGLRGSCGDLFSTSPHLLVFVIVALYGTLRGMRGFLFNLYWKICQEIKKKNMTYMGVRAEIIPANPANPAPGLA
jgi:hypothetical protein